MVDSFIASLTKSRIKHDVLEFDGTFKVELWRDGKLIKEVGGKNGVTIIGKNHMLDVTFGAASPVTQINPWYLGLINSTPSPFLSESDTLGSHTGWSEFAGYSGNRKTWDDADSVSKVKGTTVASLFTMNTGATIYGSFLASANSGNSGLLWSAGAFDTPVTVENLNELKVTYGIRT